MVSAQKQICLAKCLHEALFVKKPGAGGDKVVMCINEKNEWVKAFQARYGRKKEAANKILEYLCRKFNEKENSNPPADGYERIVANHCMNPECEAGGRCTGKPVPLYQDASGKSTLKVGGLRKVKRAEIELTERQRLELLLALQRCYPDRCVKCSTQ